MDGQRAETVRLEVPAEPEYLRVVRLTASAVGAVADFDVARIEDLRIAVDELAAAAMSAAAPDANLLVSFRAASDAIEITGTAASDSAAALEPIGEQIVRAVVGRFSFESADGVVAFSCRVHRMP
jgi:serine/threonine-protein kinase RsbW